MGAKTYNISRNHLCIYTPNTFLHILERSHDLAGILEEDDVDAYYPVVSLIDIRKRLRIRDESCVALSEREAAEIVALMDVIGDAKGHVPFPPLTNATATEHNIVGKRPYP